MLLIHDKNRFYRQNDAESDKLLFRAFLVRHRRSEARCGECIEVEFFCTFMHMYVGFFGRYVWLEFPRTSRCRDCGGRDQRGPVSYFQRWFLRVVAGLRTCDEEVHVFIGIHLGNSK